MGQQSSASGSRLLDLDDFQLVSAELVGGEWQLAVQTTATLVGCAGCGVRATPHVRLGPSGALLSSDELGRGYCAR